MLVCFLMAVCAGCGPAPTASPESESLAKGVKYLWSKQAADGGWHSFTYGLLRSGQSLTPFVLDTLLQAPSEHLSAGGVKRAVEFITKNVNAKGGLGLADPLIPDYPNYATALAVQALSRARPAGYEQAIAPMIAYLRSQQLADDNGWKLEEAPYGGWGIGGDPRTPPHPGHVDISMTRYVLQAMRMSGVPASDLAIQRARTFVERCQNFDPANPDAADGGFFFSTVVLDANKAGHDGKRYRSYGTTTADGILALIAMGTPLDHPRVRAASRWLSTNHMPIGAPGFVGEPYQKWKAGLKFYYAGIASDAFRALNLDLAGGSVPHLLKEQRADGSWSNAENLVKEDDPLIATPFAIRALVNAGVR